MNNNTSCYKRWLVCAAVAVSAVFGAASAQDGDDAEAFDFGASMRQLEAPAADEQPAQSAAEESAPPAPAPAVVTQDAAVPSGEGASGGDDDEGGGQQSVAGKSDGRAAADKAGGEGGSTPLFGKREYELNLGMATVNGQPWTRIALGIDVPIWKFGVFLDLELFIDDESKVSDKGWDLKHNTAEFFFRKIRYIRYGHEDEPLFVKFGGLSNVTIGYGLIVDRFTNMLRYPDEKLLGLQFYLNDILPIGLTVQTLISDFAEMNDSAGVGGVYAVRGAVRLLKPSGIFLLDGLSLGGMLAVDANVQAPANKWKVGGDDAILRDMRDKYDSTDFFNDYKIIYQKYKNQDPDAVLSRLKAEDSLRRGTRSFAVFGVDAGLPIFKTDFFGLDVYGQWAIRADKITGWGIGAPGFAVRVWKLNGNIEYRKIEGRFTPGYFDTYYLDERYSRGIMKSKDEYIDSISVDGVFGRLGMDVFGILNVSGAYQYMIGKDAKNNVQKSQFYETTAGIGETIMSRIPKINLAEVYVRNANIGIYNKYDEKGNIELINGVPQKAWLFDRSPGMYWGYRTGFEITAGASLIWDYRYGWKVENGKLVSDNHMLLQTALRF